VTHPAPRFVIVADAARDIGTSTRTVHRAIQRTTQAVIPRDRFLLPTANGTRMMQQTVVEINALRAYLDTQQPGRPRHN
jgi:hypothetical protein